jgi:glutamate synthase domain-containing protein 2
VQQKSSEPTTTLVKVDLKKACTSMATAFVVQVASGRFGVHPEYLKAGAAVEIKIGQGAKPGTGGHLPGEKVSAEISRTR